MPAPFMQPGFFKLAKSRLKRGGLFLMNVIVEDDDDPMPDNLVRTLRQQWRGVRLLDTDGWTDRNAVIAAGAVTNLKKAESAAAARARRRQAGPPARYPGLALRMKTARMPPC